MSSTPTGIETTLLEQSNGLRALAGGLLGDEHSAEDVVQDIWLKVHRLFAGSGGAAASGAAIRNPGGWLRRAASRAALNRRRAELRRSQHELRATTDATHAAAADVLAQREVMRRVVEGVLGLDEPYRSVIIMRYYKDMAPRQIAKLRGVPVATVASQLHRARASLRARLDDLQGGDGRAWAGALVAALRPESAAARTSLAPLIASAGAVLVAGAIAAFVMSAPSSGSGDGLPGRAQPAHAAAALLPQDAPASGAQDREGGIAAQGRNRSPVRVAGTTRIATAIAPAAHAFELTVLVVGEHDLPQPRAQILLAPFLHPLNHVGHTDDEGRLVLRWRGRDPRMQLELGVRVRRAQLEGGLRRIVLDAGRPHEVRLAIGHQAVLPGPSGPHAPRTAGGVPPGPSGPRAQAWMQSGPPEGLFDDLGWASVDEQGWTHFAWPAVLASGELMFEDVTDHWEAETGVFFEEARDLAHLRGQLRDAYGRPLGNGVIAVKTVGAWQVHRADDEGFFDIELEPQGAVELRAGGGRMGLAFERIEFAGDDPTLELNWNPVLDRGHEIRGRVVLAGSKGPIPWLVECTIEEAGATYSDWTGAYGGSFAIPNLARGSGRLELSHPRQWPFAIRSEAVTAPSFELALELDSIEDGRVEIALASSAGGSSPEADVRLVQLDTGRSAWLTYDDASNRHVRSSVPPGRYGLSAGTAITGYRDLGVVTVEGGATNFAGSLRLAAPGRLEIALSESAYANNLDWIVVRRGAGVDSEIQLEELGPEPDVPMLLAPGAYLVILRGEHMAAVAERVAVKAGEMTRVDLDPGKIGELILSAAPGEEEQEARPSPFRVTNLATSETVYAHTVEPGEDLRLFLPQGRYHLRAGAIERDLQIEPGTPLRTEL